MLVTLALLLSWTLLQDSPPAPDPAAELAARVGELIMRAGASEDVEAGALRGELLALGPIAPPLFALLADWRTAPLAGEDDGRPLGEAERALTLSVVAALPRGEWKETRASLPHSDEPALLRAGLRLEGALARSGSVRTLYTLARRAQELGRFEDVAEAFEEGLGACLRQDPKATDVLRSAWRELDPALLPAVLGALEHTPSTAALECLWSWLGKAPGLEAGVLLALGNLQAWLEPARRERLVLDVQARLAERDPGVQQAAATTLGRIGTPESVPWLIELLASEDAAGQRAALHALRAIGGVRLPGSIAAWRSWYGREETWFQEHAPALLEELVAAADSEDPVPPTRALLRSLGEHRLHRDELASALEPLLRHARPRLRLLACQTFERLEARRALPWLVAALGDEVPQVASAAHAALCTIEGVVLGTQPELWRARLGLGLAPNDV